MSEYDKESLRIYMSYHASEVKHLHSETRSRWYEGQKLYEKKIKTK